MNNKNKDKDKNNNNTLEYENKNVDISNLESNINIKDSLNKNISRCLNESELEIVIKKTILIKIYYMNYDHLYNIVDHCIILSDYDIDLDDFYESQNSYTEIQEYYINKCLNYSQLVEVCSNNYIIKSKNNDLLQNYYRITNNNYLLLYTAINNFSKIKKIYSNMVDDSNSNIDKNSRNSNNTESNNKTNQNNTIDTSNDDKKQNSNTSSNSASSSDNSNLNNDNNTSNNSANSSDDSNPNSDSDSDSNTSSNSASSSDNSKQKYVDVLSKIKPKLETINLETNNGRWGYINFYKLDDKSHNYIQNLINIEIEKIIVKKTFVNKMSERTKANFDNDAWNNRGDGCKGQFTRETKFLKKVYKEPHFPILLSTKKENEIYINYCGEKINENNIPSDWKIQIDEIVSILSKKNIIHNDMHIGNFLIYNNIIYLVDFGWASNKKYWPYCNVISDNINEHDNFIKLLDAVSKNGIKDRIKFRKQYSL